jgi:hypothetical protein
MWRDVIYCCKYLVLSKTECWFKTIILCLLSDNDNDSIPSVFVIYRESLYEELKLLLLFCCITCLLARFAWDISRLTLLTLFYF